MGTRTEEQATAEQLGIGMRFSIHPLCDDFVEVILGSLADVETAGLTDGLVIDTDEVSTWVGAHAAPAEERLAEYLAAVIAAASRRSGCGHVVTHALFSRGCPGEVSCDLAVTGLPAAAPVRVEPTGIQAQAEWSLYPLPDVGSADHMVHIESAIAAAQARGVAASTAHYATSLVGDVADVLAAAVDAWAQIGAHVAHVVTHLTVSVGSAEPTDEGMSEARP